MEKLLRRLKYDYLYDALRSVTIVGSGGREGAESDANYFEDNNI